MVICSRPPTPQNPILGSVRKIWQLLSLTNCYQWLRSRFPLNPKLYRLNRNNTGSTRTNEMLGLRWLHNTNTPTYLKGRKNGLCIESSWRLFNWTARSLPWEISRVFIGVGIWSRVNFGQPLWSINLWSFYTQLTSSIHFNFHYLKGINFKHNKGFWDDCQFHWIKSFGIF